MISECKIIVFCDGASSGNPGPGGWGAIVSYPTGSRGVEVNEIGGSDKHTTNNRMELSAAAGALESIGSTKDPIVVYTDSAYVINGITKWVFGWRAKNWQTLEKKDVMNRDLWERLYQACVGKKIDWQKISGHSGVAGNERVDEIATSFSTGKAPSLFKGIKKNYSVKIDDLTQCEVKTSTKSRSGAKAYSYLSLVDGEFHIDKTWAECEARVKGKAKAKFRKSLSAEDERGIMREWKVE